MINAGDNYKISLFSLHSEKDAITTNNDNSKT